MDILAYLKEILGQQAQMGAQAPPLAPSGIPPSMANQAPQVSAPMTPARAPVSESPGPLGAIGNAVSNAYGSFENANLGPGYEQLTPEQRRASILRGYLTGIGTSLATKNPGGFFLGKLASESRDTRNIVGQNQIKQYTDYLDQRIAATNDPDEKNRLMVARLTHTAPAAAPPQRSEGYKTRLISKGGKPFIQTYSAVDGHVTDEQPYYVKPSSDSGISAGKREDERVTRISDRDWFSSLSPQERKSIVLVDPASAQRARNAVKALPGERIESLRAYIKSLDAPPPAAAAQPEGPGVFDRLGSWLSGDNQSKETSGPSNAAIDAQVQKWSNPSAGDPLGASSVAPPHSVVPSLPTLPTKPPLGMALSRPEEYRRQFEAYTAAQSDQRTRDAEVRRQALIRSRAKAGLPSWWPDAMSP